MKKHGLKVLMTSLSLAILFSAMCGLGSKASAQEEATSFETNINLVQPAVLRLDRQVGISIEQKKCNEIAAEAARQSQEAAEKAAKLASQVKYNKKTTTNTNYSKKTSVSYTASIGEKVVAAAMTRLGIHYGAVIDGVTYDCSGLTQWAYKQLGINISRSSYTQANECTKIDKNNLQLGDLVFWQSGGTINHVGIYAGGGMVIDASPSGVVKRAIFETSSQKIAFYGRPY